MGGEPIGTDRCDPNQTKPSLPREYYAPFRTPSCPYFFPINRILTQSHTLLFSMPHSSSWPSTIFAQEPPVHGSI